MNILDTELTAQWTKAWLDSVALDLNTMSQLRLSSIQKHAGGLEAVKAMAEHQGIHLLLLEDDERHDIIAASKKPFRVMC